MAKKGRENMLNIEYMKDQRKDLTNIHTLIIFNGARIMNGVIQRFTRDNKRLGSLNCLNSLTE